MHTPQAHAQGMMLEEVVVTARRREESLQETPVAVSAFGADEMRAAQINGVGDLTARVPGLSRREGRKEADLSIRGVGQRVRGANADPAVGVYVDNIFIPRSDSQLVDAINLESVQVLRGPQGTLFGKNTAGGALLLTTRKPSEEAEGFMSGNFGDLGRTKVRIGQSGPLTERLAGGIVVDYASEDGYREDAETNNEYGDTDRRSVLGQLSYQGDSFEANLMLFWGKQEEHFSPVNCVLASVSGALQGFTAPGDSRSYVDVCNQSEALLSDEKVLMDEQAQPWEMTNRLGGLTLQWDLGDLQFKSITGYLYQDDILQGGEVDASPIFTINNRVEANRQLRANGFEVDGEERTFYSQEFQLIGSAFDDFLDFTVGAFASQEEIEATPSGGVLGLGGFIGQRLPNGDVSVLPPSIAGVRGLSVSDFDNESWAIFGQGILNLSDYWQLTLGLRYTEEKKEADQTNYSTASLSPGVLTRAEFDALATGVQDIILDPNIPRAKGDDEWSVWTPAITLTAFAPESLTQGALSSGMLYLSVSEGFKAGGFTAFGDELLAFDPEEILSYEIGAKLDMLDQTLRINTSIYYSEYDDIQLRVTRTIDEFTTLDGIINAAEATMTGAEIEVNWLPIEHLILGLTGAWIDAEYDDFFDEDAAGMIVDRSREEFAYIPEQTWSLMAQYTWDLDVGELSQRISGFYTDGIFIGLDAAAADEDIAYLEDYWVWNIRVAFRPEMAQGLELAAYANNIFDEEYIGTGIISTSGVGAAGMIPGKQQTWGVEMAYNW
jgi:iron complex outermembrane receptor protein